ncbi:MAG TPA: acetamidase/formamidase family protein [Mycobacteriales bacterium]|nr:acetamidase/formamidase family protein [Mycobacteriales bacterium]
MAARPLTARVVGPSKTKGRSVGLVELSSRVPDAAVLRTGRDTALWGWFPTDRPPVLTVESGAVVRIETVNQMGASAPGGPVAYFTELGVPAGAVLPELAEVAAIPRTPGSSGHVLVGPVHVAGAEPGDTLEVQVLDVSPRVDYGVNATGPNCGVLPDLLTAGSTRLLRLDSTGRYYQFAPGIAIPFRPFMGIMAVAPPTEAGFVSANPPDRWGGNLDFRELTAGSTLYLPVFQPGAQFYTGDSHGAQGHGEVDQTAVEHSMTLTARFRVRKGERDAPLEWPRAQNAEYVFCMGIDPDLDVALEIAVEQSVRYLVETAALSVPDAYALCSVGVDFVIVEAVDGTKVVAGYLPRTYLPAGTRAG